ncbi:MAG TPA: hypothetical protein ENI67_04515 [Gammaproteobacteria bacterium]|nr:hypothetical protein [Gammaproteobacteria bacterium]
MFPGKGKKPGEPGVKPESVLTDQQGSKGRSGITATYPNTSAALNLEARQVLSGKDNLSMFCGQLLDRDFLKAMLDEIEKRTPTIDEMYK